MEAACDRSATLPFAPESKAKLDVSLAIQTDSACTSIKVVAASSFGAILMQEGVKPLMKQRLIHQSLKFIEMAYAKGRDEARVGDSASASQIGVLMIVCYVICAGDLLKFDRATIHKTATLTVEGFSSEIFQLPAQLGTELPAEVAKTKTLIVCSVLKLVCLAPGSVNEFILPIVSGLLRSYAVSNPDSEVGCKVLSLQGLEQIAHL